MKRSILSELLCFFSTFFTENHKNRPVFLPNPCKTDVCLFVCLFVFVSVFLRRRRVQIQISLNTPGKWHLYVSSHFLCTIIFCRPFLGISKNIKFLVLNAYKRVHTIPLTSPRIILNTGLSITHVLYFLY